MCGNLPTHVNVNFVSMTPLKYILMHLRPNVPTGVPQSLHADQPPEEAHDAAQRRQALQLRCLRPRLRVSQRAPRSRAQARARPGERVRGVRTRLPHTGTAQTPPGGAPRPVQYDCGECGKSFQYPSQLQNHMMKHKDIRPFICSECGMEFIQSHHLKQHTLTHKVRGDTTVFNIAKKHKLIKLAKHKKLLILEMRMENVQM